MIGYSRSIAICLVAIMIGWQLSLDEKRYHAALVVFASLTLLVGLMQVFVNVGGFEIHDQYETDHKNALGVMLATGGIIFLVMGFNSKAKRIWQLMLYALAIISFSGIAYYSC
jgi:hypothetical protein